MLNNKQGLFIRQKKEELIILRKKKGVYILYKKERLFIQVFILRKKEEKRSYLSYAKRGVIYFTQERGAYLTQ